MALQWMVVSLFLAGVLVALGRCLCSGKAWGLLLLTYVIVLAAAGWWQAGRRARQQEQSAQAEKIPAPGGPPGYVTSDRCQACHPSQYDSWHRSYHRTMTQRPSPEAVRGQFHNVTLELNGDQFHLEQRGEEFWVDMVDPDWSVEQALRRVAYEQGRGPAPEKEPHPPRTWQRISMLTGSHHMQAYWTASQQGNRQLSFPFTFFFEENRWVPRNAVFLIDPLMRFDPQIWNKNCINCHATVGQPRRNLTNQVFSTRAVELGIACEACHGPAEAHARLNQDPIRRYAQHRQDQPDPSIFNPARADHVKSSEACGQCHAVRRYDPAKNWNSEGVGFIPGHDLEERYPSVPYDGHFEPGQESKRGLMEGLFWSDGEVRVSGREFSGMAASGCYQRGRISCLSCHSMHRYQDTDDQLAAGMESNQACAQCHATFATTLTGHTHHRAASSGSLCVNCHMPHTTYGLVGAIRNHHIDAPTIKATLATGRPNACNLCHLDRTLDWTGRQLHEWYGQPLAPLTGEQHTTAAALLWLLQGDAGQRALTAWNMGWPPARQTAGEQWLAPYLAELLVDPYATVRCIAQRSLRRLPGFEHFAYDYIAPLAERAAGRQRALAIWRGQTSANGSRNAGSARPSEPAARDAVLLQPDGSRQENKVAALLQQRDNRRMELLE